MNTSEDCRGKEILLIEGTNRPLSLTSIVARYYAMFLEEKGIKVDRLSLDKLSPNFICKQRGETTCLCTACSRSHRSVAFPTA